MTLRVIVGFLELFTWLFWVIIQKTILVADFFVLNFGAHPALVKWHSYLHPCFGANLLRKSHNQYSRVFAEGNRANHVNNQGSDLEILCAQPFLISCPPLFNQEHLAAILDLFIFSSSAAKTRATLFNCKFLRRCLEYCLKMVHHHRAALSGNYFCVLVFCSN